MKVSIVTTAYNLPNATTKMIETARADGLDLLFYLFLHSKHPPTVNRCEELAKSSDVVYYPYGVNRGLSNSWNEGILDAYDAGADVVLVVNDDIYFTKGDVTKIATKALENPDKYICSVAGWHEGFNKKFPSHGYSCFAINKDTLTVLGCFDQNIFPIYLEDCDYAYRAGLAGLSETNTPDTMVFHGGSSAINNDPALNKQNGMTHGKNSLYYNRKWGGSNGAEIYKRPFNDPDVHPYHIVPKNRHTPFGPKYDRTDHHIVVL